MTKKDKVKMLQDWCDQRDDCAGCMFLPDKMNWCYRDANGGVDTPEEVFDDALKRIGLTEEVKEQPKEAVDHPNHYNRDGAMECIDEMVLIFGNEAVKHFCLCNSWKYRYRSSSKNGEEDLKKSDWYIRKYKELCSNE